MKKKYLIISVIILVVIILSTLLLTRQNYKICESSNLDDCDNQIVTVKGKISSNVYGQKMQHSDFIYKHQYTLIINEEPENYRSVELISKRIISPIVYLLNTKITGVLKITEIKCPDDSEVLGYGKCPYKDYTIKVLKVG